jgi:hypothetical protein
MRFRDEKQEAEAVWGAPRIALVIGQTEAATFHLLKRGRIPGARRYGSRWCLHLPTWRRSFESQPEAAA